jgi:hypothetical protein
LRGRYCSSGFLRCTDPCSSPIKYSSFDEKWRDVVKLYVW